MKTISIGSSKGCNIYINDVTISKQHALILISKWGSLQIVNLGESGTTVNGIRIRSHVPTPLKRGNLVCVGHVYEKKYTFIMGALLASLAVGILAFVLYSQRLPDTSPDFWQPNSPLSSSAVASTDNGEKERNKIQEKKKDLLDSILTPQQLWERSGKTIPVEISLNRKRRDITSQEEPFTSPVNTDEKEVIDSIVGEDVPLDIEIEISEEDTTSFIY